MARDFYESVTGAPAAADAKFTVYSGIEVWVYVRGVATLGNFRTLGVSAASIYQRDTGVAAGPSPEAGATGGPNPFTTGASGSIQFWAERGKYDIFVHDLTVPARIADRLIPWDASPSGDVRFASLNAEITSLLPPIGSTIGYGGASDPAGGNFLLADGRLIDRTTYATYFATVGHAFNGGVDPGNNKVRIQDKRGRVTVGPNNMGTAQAASGRTTTLNALGNGGGAETVTLTAAQSGLPAHAHTASSGNDTPDHTHNIVLWWSNNVWFDTLGSTYYNINLQNTLPTQGANARHTHPITVNSVAAAAAAAAHSVMQPFEVENSIVRVL